MNKKLLEILICPSSSKPLRYSEQTQELICDESALAYPIEDGIPILLIDRARKIERKVGKDNI